MGPTKFVAGPLALVVDIVIACDLTVFYSYLVLAQGQLRSLTRWGHLMTSDLKGPTRLFRPVGAHACVDPALAIFHLGVCLRSIRGCGPVPATTQLRPANPTRNGRIPLAAADR